VKPWSRRSVGMLLISLIAASAAGYEHPLDSSAIRNAYFLGSGNSESVRFLSKYKRTLPPPKSGPHIAEMEVRTPFAQVVVSSREHSVGYSPMQAEQDYKKDPDTLRLRIQIRFTTFGAPLVPPPACQGVNRMNSVQDCFHDFRFHFSQSKDLQPIRSEGVPIYSGGDSSVLISGDVWFTFRAAEVASAPLRVTVSTPDGHEVSATFDLAALR
jgi:hypothetical protein